MSSFEGAHDLILNNCTVNTVGGDGTFNSFTVAVSNADDETLPDRLIDLLGGPLLVNSPIQFIQHMTGLPLPPDFCKKVEKHVLSQKISNLPHASAAYDDYTTQDKRRVACFKGTREALLQEIAEWIISLTDPRLYLLWGIAGVGKSTVAQTVAERADNLRRLGASFFFSRNEADRKNARMVFTTIAFQLCVFSEDFASAIEGVLLTQRGHAAISKEPLEQLNVLILELLRNFNDRDIIPIVIVLDALDECDDQDGPTIFVGLVSLVRELPFFRVILTSRPQPHIQHLVQNPNTQTEFRVYHKSFPDYLTDDTRCNDDNLRIVPRSHHTRIAVRCLQLLNRCLKKNILSFETHRGFVKTNAAKLGIPGYLRYACVHWAKYVEGADIKNANLANELETFLMGHLLHWLEALSLINNINAAYPALRILSKYMTSTSDTSGIISDALRFIARFSEQIRRSALYTYYCALPFTPTNCPLYKIYSKELSCRVEGIPTRWDALMTSFEGEGLISHPVFSRDGSNFASSSYDKKGMRFRDAESGTLLRTYEGNPMAVSEDFYVAAMSKDHAVWLWNVAINAPVATITPPKKVVKLALSFDGSRLAVGFSDSIVSLWDAMNGKLRASLEDDAHWETDRGQHRFSPRSNRLASISPYGTILLWNEDDGGLVASMDYKLKRHYKFVFSRDGRHGRLASLTKDHILTLWDVERGILIDVTRNVGNELAISEDGSLIATGGREHPVQLWSGKPLSLVDTLGIPNALDLAISCDTLAISSFDVKLYDIKNRTLIAPLDLKSPRRLALSSDCTRLVVEYEDDSRLYDVTLLRASIPVPKRQSKSKVSALAFSPDSSRLASGLKDGTVELWDPNCAEQPIATHKLHSSEITVLAFSFDGQQFASGCWGGMVRFWGGKDGVPMGQLEHSFTGTLAFSPDLLAVAAHRTITLLDNKSLLHVGTLGGGGRSLKFSRDGTLLASASCKNVTVWNVAERAS